MTVPVCAIEGCDGPLHARGWCRKHYRAWWTYGDPMEVKRMLSRNPEECRVGGCDRRPVARGLCRFHYQRWHRTGDTAPSSHCTGPKPGITRCKVDGCDQESFGRGYCQMHYSRVLRDGDPGPAAKRLRSLRTKAGGGYIRILAPEHPAAHQERVLEHRLVMETTLGRYLLTDEHVHHINGDRTDNRADNLELWIQHHPKGQRVQDLVAWAREVIDRYDDYDGLRSRHRSDVAEG